jgi:hypothetical protein
MHADISSQGTDIDWHSLSDEELDAIEAFALAAQRRHDATAEEKLMVQNRPR